MSQATSTPASPEVTPYTGPGITMETKLMKQYRLASPVDAGSEGVAVRNANGQVELFTVATDGAVWNVYPDSSSDTGYRKAKTGLIARPVDVGARIAAGLDHDGSIVVFARTGRLHGVSYATKRKGVWSPTAPATLPDEYTGSNNVPVGIIRDIRARTIDGKLFVAVIGSCAANGPPYLAVSNWSATPGRFQSFTQQNSLNWSNQTSLLVGTGFWTRTELSPTPVFSVYITFPFMEFLTLDQNCNLIEKVTSPSGQLPPPASATVDVESKLDSVGRNKIFNVYAGGGALYQLVRGVSKDGSPRILRYQIEQLKKPASLFLRKVYAVHDHKGGTHLLCISKANELYHLPPDPKSPTGYPPLIGLPIKKNVQWVAVARNDAGNIELFYPGHGAAAPLVHLTLDQDTQDWEEQTIEVQSASERENKFEEFISYSTDLSFTDAAGVPLAEAAVTIRASDRTAVTVNNATFSVDAVVSAPLTTDAAGKLTITHQTSGLSVPDLWLHVDKLMTADEVLVLQQYGNGREAPDLPREMKSIRARLKDVTKDELKDAKDAKGGFLLKEKYRNDGKTPAAIAKACNDCMSLQSSTPSAALHPLISRKGTWTGVHIESPAAAAQRCRIIPHDGLPSWSLAFGENGVEHRRLTPQEAQAKMDEMRANALPAATGGLPWWSSIGDFFESILEGIGNIVYMVVDGVRATFELLIDGVKYVFDAVVKFVQEAFDMLESVLATVYDDVTNFFERTFEWIGFLFDWPDIVRTQDALAHTVDVMFEFLQKAAPLIKGRVDEKFRTAKGEIKTYFDTLIAQTGAGTSLGSTAKQNDRHDPAMAYSLGNNVVANSYANNWQNAKVSKSMLATTAMGETNSWMQTVQQFATDNQGKPEVTKVTTFFSSFDSPDKFFDAALKSLYQLLENLILAVVDGTQAIVDKVLELITEAITALRHALTTEVQVPLVSELFKSCVGRPLTALNLITLVAAIPTTILFKAIHAAAPFPDDSSVDAFKREFTAEWLLQASGLQANATATALTAVQPPAPISKKIAVRLQLACAVMTSVYGSLTAVLDVVAGTNTLTKGKVCETGAFKLFSGAAFVLEVALQVCSAPYIYKAAPSDAVVGVWWYQSIAGLGIDALSLYFGGGALPEHINGGPFLGAVIAGLYGLGDFIGNFLKFCEDVGSVQDLLPTFAEIAKFGLYEGVILEPPYGWVAIPVVAGLSGVMYNISAILQVLNIKEAVRAEQLVQAPS
jgi:hypothetical protein